MSNQNSSEQDKQVTIKSIAENLPDIETKLKCIRAGIMDHIHDGNQRLIIYNTVAKNNSEEELRKFFRGEISLKPGKKWLD